MMEQSTEQFGESAPQLDLTIRPVQLANEGADDAERGEDAASVVVVTTA